MVKLNTTQAAEIMGAKHYGPNQMIAGLATDSRQVQTGNLFFAWRGEATDGHEFCPEAIKNGAVALVVNRQLEINITQLVVQDSIAALGKLAAYWRNQFHLPVVGVTGSNGKTTVKNMLASIFNAAVGKNYLAPKKSFNNNVGVPLTLSELSASDHYAVIEMGMNHFGELSYLTQLVKPTVTVITNAAESHLAGVGGTVAGVAKAKAEIMQGLAAEGIAVLNADDAYFTYWLDQAKPRRVLSFGIDHPADIMAKDSKITLNGGEFLLSTPQGQATIHLPLLGRHNVMNALAAAAAAYSVGINLSIIKQGLESVEPEPHRLQYKKAQGGAVLLDDAYNANPNSMRQAIAVLSQFPGTRILVLGDMRELGETENHLHVQIGQYAKQLGIEHLFAVGDLMHHAVTAFGQGAKHFTDKPTLLTYLQAYLQPNHVLLVKGSFSMGMIAVVQALEA